MTRLRLGSVVTITGVVLKLGGAGRCLGSGAAIFTVFGLWGILPSTRSASPIDSRLLSLTQGTWPAVVPGKLSDFP